MTAPQNRLPNQVFIETVPPLSDTPLSDTPLSDTPVATPSFKVTNRAFWIRFGIGTAIVAVLILASVGPRMAVLGLAQAPAIHLHAPDFAQVAAAPLAIQLHLAAVLTALAIGIVLLAGVKGSLLHRTLGWIWVAAMMTGAVSSLFIRVINHGSLSYIHLLSGWTIVALPMAVAFARRHKVGMHARLMTGLFTGGLILAGALAFLPGRLMWRMFLG